jgi:catechol 2,3-dioxygenase-like lactoylglutathione lyase family enzyme
MEKMINEFPIEGMALTHILVVSDIEKSKSFYTDILGAKIYREYGGNSCVLNFLGSWLLIVTGGGPAKDKPDISFTIPQNANSVSHSMTIRVPDCQKAYEILKSRGAKFITPPVDWGMEIRCFFRDPDSHLFEISQSMAGKS